LINFNFGFFALKNLSSIIKAFSDIPIFIILHSTKDINLDGSLVSLREIRDDLNQTKILVHNIEDLNHLKNIGLNIENLYLFPHGVNRYVDDFLIRDKVVTLASYGFFLPHKGVLELIEAFAILEKRFPDLSCYKGDSRR